MNDDVPGIEQDPIARRHTFRRHPKPFPLQFFLKMFGHGDDLALRTAAGDHQMIRDQRTSPKIDDNHVLGFIGIKHLDDDGGQCLRLGRLCGHGWNRTLLMIAVFVPGSGQLAHDVRSRLMSVAEAG